MVEVDPARLRRIINRMSGGKPPATGNIGPIGGPVTPAATPGTDALLQAQQPMNTAGIATAIKELSQGALRQFNLSERDIRRLYRGVNFDLRKMSDPYLQQLMKSLLSQGLNMRQIMRDPAFMEYAGGLKDELVTGRENMASDLSWIEKFRNIEKDSFNALLLQNQMGVPGAVAGGGGGGGGGGGYRRGGYGGGYGSSGGGDDPVGQMDVSEDTGSEFDWFSPHVNQMIAGAGGMVPGGRRQDAFLQRYINDVKGAPNEKQLVKFLRTAMAEQKIVGPDGVPETDREYQQRREKVGDMVTIWARSGGETGGPNAALPNIQQFIDDVAGSNETLQKELRKATATAEIETEATAGPLSIEQQLGLVNKTGSKAKSTITPEVLEYLQAKVARDKILGQHALLPKGTVMNPVQSQQISAATGRMNEANKGLYDIGISPGTYEYMQNTGIDPFALGKYYGGQEKGFKAPEITSPREAYLASLKGKARPIRRELRANRGELSNLHTAQEVARALSANWGPQETKRTVDQKTSTDWTNIDTQPLSERPGPPIPKGASNYQVTAAAYKPPKFQPRTIVPPTAAPAPSPYETPSYDSTYTVGGGGTSSPVFSFEKPGGYSDILRNAVERNNAMRRAAVVANSYGGGGTSAVGITPRYSGDPQGRINAAIANIPTPKPKKSSYASKALAGYFKKAHKALAYGGGTSAVGIT